LVDLFRFLVDKINTWEIMLPKKLKPNFGIKKKNLGLNDGAAAVVMMSLEDAIGRNLKPLVKIVSHAAAGVPPEIMGTGPIPAVRKAVS
jgi:acetyl-CoA acetyltransferase